MVTVTGSPGPFAHRGERVLGGFVDDIVDLMMAFQVFLHERAHRDDAQTRRPRICQGATDQGAAESPPAEILADLGVVEDALCDAVEESMVRVIAPLGFQPGVG